MTTISWDFGSSVKGGNYCLQPLYIHPPAMTPEKEQDIREGRFVDEVVFRTVPSVRSAVAFLPSLPHYRIARFTAQYVTTVRMPCSQANKLEIRQILERVYNLDVESIKTLVRSSTCPPVHVLS